MKARVVQSASGAADGLTRAGAERLASALRVYWQRQGYDVRPVVKPMRDLPNISSYLVTLPNFVNGMPPRSCAMRRNAGDGLKVPRRGS